MDEIEWEEEDDLDDYAPFREDLRRVNTEWDKFVTVEPPDSNEAFRFMERFTHAITGERMYQILTNALQRPKPFKNFNAIVHQSPVREAWFAFKQKCLEEYVFNELLQSLQENSL